MCPNGNQREGNTRSETVFKKVCYYYMCQDCWQASVDSKELSQCDHCKSKNIKLVYEDVTK